MAARQGIKIRRAITLKNTISKFKVVFKKYSYVKTTNNKTTKKYLYSKKIVVKKKKYAYKR